MLVPPRTGPGSVALPIRWTLSPGEPGLPAGPAVSPSRTSEAPPLSLRLPVRRTPSGPEHAGGRAGRSHTASRGLALPNLKCSAVSEFLGPRALRPGGLSPGTPARARPGGSAWQRCGPARLCHWQWNPSPSLCAGRPEQRGRPAKWPGSGQNNGPHDSDVFCYFFTFVCVRA